MADERVAAGHALGADRERQCDRGEQTFGDKGDGDADREEETVGCRHSDQERKAEESDTHGHRDERDDARHPIELSMQWRLRAVLRMREHGDIGQARVCTGCHDLGAGLALDDEAARVHGVTDSRVSRHTLTRQRRHIDGERVDRLQTEVGRHSVAAAEHDDVANHDVFGRGHRTVGRPERQ